jgi:hypothetical protein
MTIEERFLSARADPFAPQNRPGRMGKRESARSVRNDGVGGEARSWWAAGRSDGGMVGRYYGRAEDRQDVTRLRASLASRTAEDRRQALRKAESRTCTEKRSSKERAHPCRNLTDGPPTLVSPPPHRHFEWSRPTFSSPFASCEWVGLRREKSLPDRAPSANCHSARRSFLFVPWFMHRHSPSPHCHSTIPSATISRRGPHLPRLLNGQQIRRPLRRRNQQPRQTNRPTQKPTSPRLHAKIQRNETGVVRTPRRRAFSAISREKEIKAWRRSKKVALIESLNPQWNDLSSQL